MAAIAWQQIPLHPFLGLLVLSFLLTFAFHLFPQAGRHQVVLGATFVIDVLLLLIMLSYSGGPSNPFTLTFLLYVVLGGLLLSIPASIGITCLSIAAYAALFFVADPHAHHHHHGMNNHLIGMCLAFALIAPVINFAMLKIRQELTSVSQKLMRRQKLDSLTTLAAGAAHELATPLSTIALIAKDLETFGQLEDVKLDAKEIREEVERCRQILWQLSMDTGSSMGEMFQNTTLDDLVKVSMEGLSVTASTQIKIAESLKGQRFFLPVRVMGKALHGLIRNAHEASSPDQEVQFLFSRHQNQLKIQIIDTGKGMNTSTLERVGEPFFTTKQQGMGLGVFIAQSMTEQLRGNFVVSSKPDRGCHITIMLPWSRICKDTNEII